MGGGVKVIDTKRISIGDGTILDTLNPEGIILDRWVTITMKCVILSHYYDTSKRGRIWKYGAGSVVTKNIPDYEIWAGNPAKFIKVRPGYEKEHSEALDNIHKGNSLS